MLFILTGDVQIGKTRWLESLVSELETRGVPCAGVLAPGVWVERGANPDGSPHFEKYGIDNVLLPGGERVALSRREKPVGEPQKLTSEQVAALLSAPAREQAHDVKAHWNMSEEALSRIDAHFERLAARADRTQGAPGLLVVDELGRLELLAGQGLVSAMGLLAQGPTPAWPVAVVVVRDYLVEVAHCALAPAWPRIELLTPGDAARERVLAEVPGGSIG